jgi:hypothetical protein
MSPIKRSLGIGSLVLASILVSLLGTEAAYRVAQKFVCIGSFPGFFEKREWGWLHKPNAQLWAYGCIGNRFEWRTWVQINSHGLRDREMAYAKPVGVRRVLLLGDSMTEALQVSSERTFADLVEQILREDGTSIEVINGGHSGFGTDNEMLFYEKEGRKYDPDLVVVVFNFQNDLIENSQELSQEMSQSVNSRLPAKQWFTVGPNESLVALAPPANALEDTWARRIATQFFLIRAVGRVLAPPPPAPMSLHYQQYAAWDSRWSAAWQVTTRLIEEIRRKVEKDGAGFAIVLMPTKEMVGVAPGGGDI